MASDHIGGSTVRFFLHLNNQASLILTKHEVLIFKVFGSGPSKLSHFNLWISTLDFTCCCYWKLKSFQGIQVNLSCILEKPVITDLLQCGITRAKLWN